MLTTVDLSPFVEIQAVPSYVVMALRYNQNMLWFGSETSPKAYVMKTLSQPVGIREGGRTFRRQGKGVRLLWAFMCMACWHPRFLLLSSLQEVDSFA